MCGAGGTQAAIARAGANGARVRVYTRRLVLEDAERRRGSRTATRRCPTSPSHAPWTPSSPAADRRSPDDGTRSRLALTLRAPCARRGRPHRLGARAAPRLRPARPPRRDPRRDAAPIARHLLRALVLRRLPHPRPAGRLVTLLGVWNEEDTLRLQQNLLGHALQQRRRPAPDLLLRADRRNRDYVLSVDNARGAVVSRPGAGAARGRRRGPRDLSRRAAAGALRRSVSGPGCDRRDLPAAHPRSRGCRAGRAREGARRRAGPFPGLGADRREGTPPANFTSRTQRKVSPP